MLPLPVGAVASLLAARAMHWYLNHKVMLLQLKDLRVPAVFTALGGLYTVYNYGLEAGL